MTPRYEIYRMMSKLGPADVVDFAATKAQAAMKLRTARNILKNHGLGGKVKVVIRDTKNRLNPSSEENALSRLTPRDWDALDAMDSDEFRSFLKPKNKADMLRIAEALQEAVGNEAYPESGRRRLAHLAAKWFDKASDDPKWGDADTLKPSAKRMRKLRARGNPKDIGDKARHRIRMLAHELAMLKAGLKPGPIAGCDTTDEELGRALERGDFGPLDPKDDVKAWRGKRTNPTLLIATNPGGMKMPAWMARDPEFKRALAKYRQFFGEEPVSLVKVTDAPRGAPRFMVSLGKAPEVSYKPADHTSKRGVPFLHSWDKPPFLALSADEKFLGYLGRGSGYKVRREGIHG